MFSSENVKKLTAKTLKINGEILAAKSLNLAAKLSVEEAETNSDKDESC